jgi:hypothetical protein
VALGAWKFRGWTKSFKAAMINMRAEMQIKTVEATRNRVLLRIVRPESDLRKLGPNLGKYQCDKICISLSVQVFNITTRIRTAKERVNHPGLQPCRVYPMVEQWDWFIPDDCRGALVDIKAIY